MKNRKQKQKDKRSKKKVSRAVDKLVSKRRKRDALPEHLTPKDSSRDLIPRDRIWDPAIRRLRGGEL